MQGGELLHEIDALAVGLVFVGWGEEREERRTTRCRGVARGTRGDWRRMGVRVAGLEGEFVLLPGGAEAGTVVEAATAPVLSLTRRMVKLPSAGCLALA